VSSLREESRKTCEILVYGGRRVEYSWKGEEEDERNSSVGRRKG
jgi:hypothetical protein